jgi:DNA gyrase subunit A
MLITDEGVIIQIDCSEISMLGRITSGVKLINLDEGVKVAAISKVRKTPGADDEVTETEETEEE